MSTWHANSGVVQCGNDIPCGRLVTDVEPRSLTPQAWVRGSDDRALGEGSHY